ADLGLEPLDRGEPVFAAGAAIDRASALGWLYVSEGSNLGAALLRKAVAPLGLSDDFGARHLAPAPEGPAAHWREFVAALDTVPLDAEEEARATEAARRAFVHVQALADACLAEQRLG
ncbi:biliverdin-producing heme oxygenase, partial [Novosphingobium sp. 1949]